MALRPPCRMGPPLRSSAADAHYCIMVQIPRIYRIQVCGAMLRAQLASAPQIVPNSETQHHTREKSELPNQGAGAALLHRHPRLSAVERLDLRLLVDREHDRVRRGVDVEADYRTQLGDELRILGQLETAHPVRVQPMRLPDPLHRRNADPDCLGHEASGPMRGFAGRIFRRRGDDPLDDLWIERFTARRAGLVAHPTLDPFPPEARPPPPTTRPCAG